MPPHLGSKIARSISVFSVRQSVELRRFHHVLFTYPDPSAHKECIPTIDHVACRRASVQIPSTPSIQAKEGSCAVEDP
ncbi:hypothetical protein ANCCAN_12737 [Ancylostoma caninum]|uniref:Uncharacterized protein n=1 Tax=Ancylostoma caninum TaxID=29170 RepID=A0A368GA79_ANCCA|nr:hypothetical protein ANCCAN_12737 [Ancylostoma caninum]